MFQKPFLFKGRIRRTEYGISWVITLLALVAVEKILHEYDGGARIFVANILYILMCWHIFAQGAKRCHDIGTSGWYQIIPFYVLWMLFVDGNININEYGPNPRGLLGIKNRQQMFDKFFSFLKKTFDISGSFKPKKN